MRLTTRAKLVFDIPDDISDGNRFDALNYIAEIIRRHQKKPETCYYTD